MPTPTTKLGLFQAGQKLINRFCEANGLRTPLVTSVSSSDRLYGVGNCGWYRENRIWIKIPACAAIGYGGRCWSYPGYVIDRTPYGVLAHELGHHIDFQLSPVSSRGRYSGLFSKSLRKCTKEPKITNYCPNDAEWFAEICRLFITNPDLLKRIRPLTYNKIAEKITPVVSKTFEEVLKHAPERTQDQAKKKINDANQRRGLSSRVTPSVTSRGVPRDHANPERR